MRLSDIIDLVALGAVWGASFLFMRIAAPEFGPLVLVEVRVVIAALFLLPIFLFHSNISALSAEWKKLSVLSVLNSAAPFYLLTFATLSITGGFAGILNATAPIFAALVAWVWLSDRLGISQILGLVIGFDEQVTPIMVVGCAIIFVGTALATGMLSFGGKKV